MDTSGSSDVDTIDFDLSELCWTDGLSCGQRILLRANDAFLLRLYHSDCVALYLSFLVSFLMGKKIERVTDVGDVDIADAGCFKYILIEVRERGNNAASPKLVVRGDASSAYHGLSMHERILPRVSLKCRSFLADVLDILESEIDPTKLTLKCVGGGRIRIDPQTRSISVYGYSQVRDSDRREIERNQSFVRASAVPIIRKRWNFYDENITNGISKSQVRIDRLSAIAD
jgi:hypothetical protein